MGGEMTLPNAMRVLAEWWDDVAARLDDEQRVALEGLTDELLQSEGVGRRDIALDIMELLMAVLSPEHPVRRAFAAESQKFERGSGDWDPALAALRPQVALIIRGGVLAARAEGPDRPGSIRREAERSLLAVPALDAAEVRRRGTDPQDPGLIRLGPSDEHEQLPAFQFGADGRPHPVVITVNLLLDAQDDPWGVADWWLGGNAWIGAVPADLIGQVDDQILIAAARAAFEEA
jgi:hypothetical protein